MREMKSVLRPPKLRLGSRQIDIFPYWIGLLLLGLATGAVGGFYVFRDGLIVTGLSNQIPWGMWIVTDISSIALGGSAFTMGVIVYLFKLKRFENIGRLAVLLGFLGYTTASMVLLFDLGQPLRFWHPLVFWQPHSLLWEVTMCVVLYVTVLGLETFPIVLEYPFFERFPIFERVVHILHRSGPILATIGLTLSLLHQASLGATYGVLSGRGMAFRPTAPILFVISAIGGGLALLFVVSVLNFRVIRPGLVKDDVLVDLARITGATLLLYMYIKIWDWAVTFYYSFDSESAMQLVLLNQVDTYSISFWVVQVLLGALIPGVLFMTYKAGGNLRLRIVGGLLAAFGVVSMRWDYNFSALTTIISYDPFTPTVKYISYTPTWQELAVLIGVLSYWLLGFSLATRFLPFQSKEDYIH
jgi:Ni/Fe-hydrogenase subunit HybB-like protein